MYYPKQKLIFVHIPKTGGSTLEYHLGQIEHPEVFEKLKGGDKMRFLTTLYKMYKLEPDDRRHNIHRTSEQYLNIDDYDNYKSISILRNPFSQIKSLYTMNSEHAKRRGKPYPSWEEYIFKKVQRPNYIQGQKNWLDQAYITSYVDELYPFEYFEQVMKYIGDEYGFVPDMKVKLWATKSQYEYTPDMVERVMDLYESSYKLWKDVKNWWGEYAIPYKQ